MDRFEEAIFSGLEPNQYEITWIEHTDKNERLELNFVIANVELETGKRLQPYYHKVDKNRINNCKDLINHDYGLSDPNAPEKRRMLTTAKDLPANKKEALEAINQAVLSRIKTREINDRKDVVNFLESVGFELARTTKQSISIKDPDGGQNLRLKGAFYEQSFEASRELTADYGELAERHRQEIARNIQRTREVYREQLEQTAERNRGLYSQAISGREKITGQLQERIGEEHNGVNFTNSASTEIESRAVATPMDDHSHDNDGLGNDGRNRFINPHVHEQIGIRSYERLEEIRRALQRELGQDRNSTLHNERSDNTQLRKDRPSIQESALGREFGLGDNEREIGAKNDRSRKTIVTYARELRSALYERISSFTERFRSKREANSTISESLSDVQNEDRGAFKRIDNAISQSSRNIEESNRLAEAVTQNNETLDKMMVKQEKSIDYGMSL